MKQVDIHARRVTLLLNVESPTFSVRLDRVRLLFFQDCYKQRTVLHDKLVTVLLLWNRVFQNVTPCGLIVTVKTLSRHRELDR
jgi:hypothetical protein